MNAKLSNLPQDPENRLEARTHLFVLAALKSSSETVPVHVRNMSSSGALVEAGALPDPGTNVTLNRGSLAARGQVAWRTGRQAGISFEASIFVSDWMLRVPPGHQGRVDEIVTSIKQGLAPPDECARGVLDILAELALLKTDLCQLANSLAGDMIIVATHPEIQLLDISLQRIDRIAARLRETGSRVAQTVG